MRRLTVVLGVPVDEVTQAEALDRIEEFVARGGRVHQVATVNSDFLARALADPELLHILRHVDLATADGMPLVWASRVLGGSIPERVTGADLVPALAERFAASGRSLFLLGARPEVARAAAKRLCQRFPGLRISGVYSPPMADLESMDHATILRRVNAVRPDALLVAFGSPKQEKWIYRHRHSLEVPVAIGIGASLDFIAGSARRAPVWMQHAGAEWLWRLGNEPRRLWRRYAGDFRHLAPGLMRYWLLTRQTRSPRPPEEGADEIRAIGPRAIRVAGRFGADQRGAFEALALQTLAGEASEPMQSAGATSPPGRPGHVYVDLTACTYIDSAGLGCLASLAHEARARGYEFRVYPGSPAIRRLLGLGGLDQHLGTADDVEGVG
ncbi:MAG: WecB/TagA/CpsF family glycosyltransferase [Armatimonadetes bacterium]|nr:WecB/TagA/CpsF family glycosyltransferase [Armatimonadota bacterium]